VLGGGDWASDRIVPDLLRARAEGVPLVLRNPDAVRPWQHVLDPLHGYLLLAQRLVDDPAGAPHALNFGPDADAGCTVAELVDVLSTELGGAPEWRRADEPGVHETAVLRLTSDLATKVLGWRPRLDVRDALRWTAAWHLAWEGGDEARAIVERQIDEFEGLTDG
jgi:CDP-glucose 4,6-dehydratase